MNESNDEQAEEFDYLAEDIVDEAESARMEIAKEIADLRRAIVASELPTTMADPVDRAFLVLNDALIDLGADAEAKVGE